MSPPLDSSDAYHPANLPEPRHGLTALQTASLDELRDRLRSDTEGVCLALLGEPRVKDRNEWRWGHANGSFAVVMRGRKRGLWNERAEDQGSDLLGLIRREVGGIFRDAYEWGCRHVGMIEGAAPPPKSRPVRDRAAEDAKAAMEKADKRAFAARLWSETTPATETVAERYLTATRGIPRPRDGWPTAVRFHPGRCALVLGATDAAGNVVAVQLVHLDADAQKRVEEGRPTKQSFGPQDGAVVRLPGDRAALLLAEGPETGLSVWSATGRETWIALGSIGKVEPPALRRLVMCADDDPRDAPAAKGFRKTRDRWLGEARDVAVATPWNPRRFDKSDFADLIRKAGPEAVATRIAVALNPTGPQAPGEALPVEMARLRLAETVARFGKAVQTHTARRNVLAAEVRERRKAGDKGLRLADVEAMEPAPVVHGVRVSVGLGKSAEALKLLAELVVEMRAAGDKRGVAIACPTHELAEQLAARFRTLNTAGGLSVAVWRGRSAPDPEAPGDLMCLDIDAVNDAQAIGADVETSVCRDEKRGLACPFFATCGAQRLRATRADVWFVPHELVFSRKPAALGKLALLVVDEAAWRKGLEGVDGPPMDLTVETMNPAGIDVGRLSALDTDRLMEIHGRTYAALSAGKGGPLRRDRLAEAGVTFETGRDGRALSWERLVKSAIWPGMGKTARREAVAEAAGNRSAMRAARLFGAVEALMADEGPQASGWAGLVTIDTPDGPQRVVRLRGRRKVAKGWAVPTLHLDANLNADLLRPYWPGIEVTADLAARTPHMRVRQLSGRDWTKSALVPSERNSPAENERVVGNRDKLRAAVWREARRVHPGRVLVVVQKGVEDAWREFGAIPANVELAHHNNVAGRDEWGPQPGRPGVVLLIVVGRTQPPTEAVERIAGALTGAAVTTRAAGFRYERRDAAVELEDGSSVGAEAECHPDPTAEAIRWQICEGELVQIIGRVRGANRTAKNPVDVLVLTDRPLPLAVAETVGWDELAPFPWDLMLGEKGVTLADAADAARCFPHFWGDGETPSPEAAKKAFQRARCGTNPYRELSIGECPAPLRGVGYRRAGRGTRPARLAFDPAVLSVDDLRDWLEEQVGELATFTVDGEETQPDPEQSSPSGQPEPVEEFCQALKEGTSPGTATIGVPPAPPHPAGGCSLASAGKLAPRTLSPAAPRTSYAGAREGCGGAGPLDDEPDPPCRDLADDVLAVDHGSFDRPTWGRPAGVRSYR